MTASSEPLLAHQRGELARKNRDGAWILFPLSVFSRAAAGSRRSVPSGADALRRALKLQSQLSALSAKTFELLMSRGSFVLEALCFAIQCSHALLGLGDTVAHPRSRGDRLQDRAATLLPAGALLRSGKRRRLPLPAGVAASSCCALATSALADSRVARSVSSSCWRRPDCSSVLTISACAPAERASSSAQRSSFVRRRAAARSRSRASDSASRGSPGLRAQWHSRAAYARHVRLPCAEQLRSCSGSLLRAR